MLCVAGVFVSQDARILGEMKLMQQIYANLFDLNRDLILEHTKRTTNHNSLLAALKNVRPSPPSLPRSLAPSPRWLYRAAHGARA